MEAVIRASEKQLEILRNMGAEIVATDKSAVIPSPFPHASIQEEVRRYIRLYGLRMETDDSAKALTEAVICRMEKSLDMDGSLSWDEVWGIIGDCAAEKQ